MRSTIPPVLRLLNKNELEEGAMVVARGMRDNPANMRVFGLRDGAQRTAAMGRFFLPVLRGLYQRGLILGAVRSNRLAGVCGMARPGFCQPSAVEKARILPAVVIGNTMTTPFRMLSWAGEWARRDPPDWHWHLGPIAVEPELQGQGIGSAMLQAFCTLVDSFGANAYLETDKRRNIDLYQRFGFTVMDSAEVLGIPNWFMLRAANREKKQLSIAAEACDGPASSIAHPMPAGITQ